MISRVKSLRRRKTDLDPALEKQSVALGSLLAAMVLTLLKIAVGVLTGSLGILSEAAHSGLDLVAAALTLVSVRAADKPADPSHPFGHGKIEHLSAFVQTALLLATCAWIIVESIRRLFFAPVRVEPNVWAFAVMFVSVSIDTWRSRELFHVARKYNSQALEADALHFSTDVYSASVVIFGLTLVFISRQRNLSWLRNADTVAALAVAGIIVYVGLRLGRRTVAALVDEAPEGPPRSIAEAVARVPGVLNQERIRVRQSGGRLFVDLRLTLPGNIPFEHAQSVVNLVESKVHELFPTADVVIHATPQEPPTHDLVERVRAIAHRSAFQVHDVTAYQVDGRVNVSLDLEVNPALTLELAHRQATALEEAIKRELGTVNAVNVHIEPLRRRIETAAASEVRQDLERELVRLARQTPEVVDVHSLEAHRVGKDILVSLHCTLEPHLPIARVHEITDQLELRFREAFPQISKVSIHAEPKGEDKQEIKP